MRSNRLRLSFLLACLGLVSGCGATESPPSDAPGDTRDPDASLQAISALGDSLFARPSQGARATQQPLLEEAQAALAADSSDATAWIWVGRRLGYLQEYRAAIDLYSAAIERFPRDARLYRHRGHRFISVRDIPAAISDLTYAGDLVAGTEDQVEPDGLPNARGIPTSTLQFNIWYHLALAHFLQGDDPAALAAYLRCMEVSNNPDAVVATSYWMYMTLRRLGRETEAQALLEPIHVDMDIIENQAYHNLLLLFKGELGEDAVLPEGEDGLAGATTLFGLANWLGYEGRAAEARTTLERLVAMEDQWSSFGYIAAEAELARNP